MIATKVAHMLAGVAIGVGAAAGLGSATAAGVPPATKSKPSIHATLALSGAKGRYLTFSGRQVGPATFDGLLTFKHAVTTGAYTLSLTVTAPAAGSTRLVYDVDARRR